MIGLHSLIVGCVAAVAGQTFGDNCNVVTWGNIDPNAWPIIDPKATLAPAVRDWKVPAVSPECPYHVGTALTVCDYDVAPEARFLDEQTALVHRLGALAGEGSSQLTYYCVGSK